MKKLILFILSTVMIFGLCGCSDKNETEEAELTVEEMVSQAEELRMSDLLYEVKNNSARAKELYNDKLVKINNFKVDSIDSYDDYAAVKMTYWLDASTVMTVTAKVPKSEALIINTGDKITVVGVLDMTSASFANLNEAHIVTE